MNPIDKLAWILIKDRKVLFVRAHGKDVFLNVGGKREGGETDVQALIREVREELNVELIPETITYTESFSAQAAGHPEGVMVRIRCYIADYQGTLTPSSEIEELAWFTSIDGGRTSITGRLILDYLKASDRID